MRVRAAEHEARHWVMGDIAPDFDLLDAWALPVEGGPDDFGVLVDLVSSFGEGNASGITRILFAVRHGMGRVFGWDDDVVRPIPGCTETTLRDRLPAALRDTGATPGPAEAYGFIPLYRTDDEATAEISNGTVHGVLQLTWVPTLNGRFEGRLGVYVKPRGSVGRIYLKLIAPFRHLIVYPALMRRVGRAWNAREAG